jgi:hypothetical protein
MLCKPLHGRSMSPTLAKMKRSREDFHRKPGLVG